MLNVSEYDIQLSRLLTEPKNNYINILKAVQEDKTQDLYENIITYVDYFYAVDFIIDKYNIRNKKVLHQLRNIEFQNIEKYEDIDNQFSIINHNYKNNKAVQELKLICKEIFDTYYVMSKTGNPLNIAHVVSSYTSPTKALLQAAKTLSNSNHYMLSTSLIKFILRNRKCNTKIINHIHKKIKQSNIEIPEIIEHPATSAKIINYYTNSESSYVRILVASHQKTTQDNLFKLVLDSHKLVRTAAYYNSNMPDEGKEAAVFVGGIFNLNEYETIIKTKSYLYY